MICEPGSSNHSLYVGDSGSPSIAGVMNTTPASISFKTSNGNLFGTVFLPCS